MKTLSKLFLLTILYIFLLSDFSQAQYISNYALGLNGSSSYAAVPWHSELQPATAFTVEAWIYPTALPSGSACIIGKNYVSSYYFGIENTGRFIFIPRNQAGGFLRSRVTGTVKVNQWTHIAGTYDGTNTRLYINGVLDTSRTGISGTVGSNFDSLYIGCDRQSGSRAYFFNGMLDNVRIWKSARTASEIFNNMFIPLSMYQLSGSYSFLAASYQFDNSAEDNSGPVQNNGFTRNITYVNFANKAVNHLDYNNSVYFNGSTDYCSHYNIGVSVSPSTAITLECWIKRDTTSGASNDRYIINKSRTFSISDYYLQLYNSGALLFGINSGAKILTTPPLITNAQWTHIAASYSSVTGVAAIYVNGEIKASTIFSGNPLINNTGNDSVYIGGFAGLGASSANRFRGQIDEVRIWTKSRSAQQIKEFMHKRPPYPSSLDDSLIIFDFDNLHSGFKIGSTNYNYGLKYIGLTSLTSAHANTARLSSPMLSDTDNGFYSTSYSSSNRRFFVPDGNSAGITDSIYISGIGNVSDLKIYLMMSHSYTQDLILTLTSPTGVTVNLLNANGGNSNDIMTIFSDEADSSASYGFSLMPLLGISPSFSPSVRPNQPLSSFSGQSRNGWWKLKCVDQAGGDVGYVHGWGINLLSYKTLNVTALIQGFYDSTENKMISDTASIYFRVPLPPYTIFDSSKAVLDSNGNAVFYFSKSNNGYRVFKHRNSIETWTSNPVPFSGDSASYDFTIAASQAYGNNQIQLNSSPVKFGIYSGDANQDGVIDLADGSLIDNDALNFASGYLSTDLNGDGIIDVADAVFADNNMFNFVGKITP